MKPVSVIWYMLMCLFFISCKEDESYHIEDEEAQLRLKVNEYIATNMYTYYLWNTQIPGISPNKNTDPKTYFQAILYEDDIWSYLTDNAEELYEELNAVNETFGYDLSFYLLSNQKDVIAVVRYTYPDSPAGKAGLKRGDLIIKINDEYLNTTNYAKTYENGTCKITLGTIRENLIYEKESLYLTSAKTEQNPVVIYDVFEKENHKIGYLLYTGFVSNFDNKMEEALTSLKSEGITDLILDLRYNSGGSESSAVLLCSAIVPEYITQGNNILTYSEWNSICQTEIEALIKEDNAYETLIRTYFTPVSYNLNLPSNRVFVLTSSSTASASELLIIGLKPYMDVIQIGENTHGKYTSMIAIEPTVRKNGVWTVDEEISNWLLLPVVAKFINKDGFTDFKDGLQPDYSIEDDPTDATPLGNPEEIMLAKAISLITGEASKDIRSLLPPTSKTWTELPWKPGTAKRNLIKTFP